MKSLLIIVGSIILFWIVFGGIFSSRPDTNNYPDGYEENLSNQETPYGY